MAKKRCLSKSDLCHIFGAIFYSSGTPNYRRLRTEYFQEEVLQKLEISPDRYARIVGGRTFNYEESQKIINYFNIEHYELETVPV